MSDKVCIRGHFETEHAVLREKCNEFYKEMEQLMEDQLLDYGNVWITPFPFKTGDLSANDYDSDTYHKKIELEPDEISVKGLISSLRPTRDDLKVRKALEKIMIKYKITKMFFCWSRAELDPDFRFKDITTVDPEDDDA